MNQEKHVYQTISSPKLPPAIGAYSPVTKIQNQFYFSGQIGFDSKSGELKSSFAEQLEQILSNIDSLLEAANLNRGNIVKTTVYLTNLGDFHLVNKAYETFFTPPFPARSCVEVKGLPKGALVEIEVIAISSR